MTFCASRAELLIAFGIYSRRSYYSPASRWSPQSLPVPTKERLPTKEQFMSKSKPKLSPKLKVKKPVSVLFKPVKADFKDLLKALAKGVGHTATGKWIELGGDAVETLSALGLATEPGELAYLLIRRSLTVAVFELVGDSASQFSDKVATDAEALVDG